MQTRAINEDEDTELSRFLVQIGGTVYGMALSDTKKEATYSITLTTGTPETFLFWADDGTYTATDLTAITPGEDGPGIAYAATAYWDGFSDAVSAELKLAVSKVTLKTTTDVPAGNPVTLTLSHTYGGYDVSAGACTGQATAKPYDYTPASGITADKDNPKEVFSFYALTDGDDSQTVTMECVNLTTRTEGITLAPGKHLILTGDVGGGTEQSVGITATISDMWAVEEAVLGLSKLTDETLASASLQGSGTQLDPYLIQSAADLLCYMNSATYNDDNTYARLCTDIKMDCSDWEPMPLDGTFDGDNHTISGTMAVNISATNSYAALFGSVVGTVRNLIMKVDITASGSSDMGIYCGGIAGYLYGTIENCENYGDIDASDTSADMICAGGIAARAQGREISGCTNRGTITGGSGETVRVGGIVGYGSGGTFLSKNHYEGGNPATEAGG